MDNQELKRFFLIVLVTSILVIAATSILIFLFGSFSEVEMRILGTMLAISISSLLGIAFSRVKTDYVRIIAITVVALMFIVTLLTIWEAIDGDFFFKGIMISIISLGLLIQSPWILRPRNNKTLRSVAVATFISASIVALMLIQLVLDFVDFNGFYFRVLGVFGILYLAGLIIGPIMKHIVQH